MQPGHLSLCYYCKHLLSEGGCTAYPAGIPRTILDGRRIHLGALPGDHGIQYERATPEQFAERSDDGEDRSEGLTKLAIEAEAYWRDLLEGT